MNTRCEPGKPVLLVVLVIYRQAISESTSFGSLRNALLERPELTHCLRLLVYDNSLSAQAIPAVNVALEYVHNPNNGGLLAAYREGLARGLEDQIPWIMLLDQDTEFSADFLDELVSLATSHLSQEQVAAIVPGLRCGNRSISPARMRFGRSPIVIEGFSGIAQFKIRALNSGSTFRTSFLQELKEVNPQFWLDFVDFLLFEELNLRGYKVFVCSSVLQHGLSAIDPDRLMPTARYQNVRFSESLFMDLYRGPVERFLYDVSLLREYFRQRSTFSNRDIPRITLKTLIRRLASTRKRRIVQSQA
ncbi:MAG TPA: glycosyltransferase [Terriglobales bacterium]|nr:glycosyltransferase [Terriglobales bacterium]